MIATTDNYKFPLIREYTLISRLLMNVDLPLQNQTFSFFDLTLGLAKSVLSPRMVLPDLGFLSDSARQVFHLIPEKENKFLKLIREVLDTETVTIKTLHLWLVNVFPSP